MFSQSLISLDLIEDFLELANREKSDKDKPPIYKGESLLQQLQCSQLFHKSIHCPGNGFEISVFTGILHALECP